MRSPPLKSLRLTMEGSSADSLPFPCDFPGCGKRFASVSKKKVHAAGLHTLFDGMPPSNPQKFNFPLTHGVETGPTKSHNAVDPARCQQCGKTFSTTKGLHLHWTHATRRGSPCGALAIARKKAMAGV